LARIGPGSAGPASAAIPGANSKMSANSTICSQKELRLFRKSPASRSGVLAKHATAQRQNPIGMTIFRYSSSAPNQFLSSVLWLCHPC
jgi:hypothetical protein